ncbi:MAG TPA: M28 family peptidase [Actinomycetospora sp.]|uniref:M28 family peptidase n=1 Tax=Actinomycetospora sp. TaxID=1872135 RepID=UPI002F427202
MPRVVAVVLLAVVVALALWSDRPPAPVAASALATEFSAERALPIVDDLAREPHPVGSPAAARVRDDVVARLRALGLAPRVDTAVVRGVAVANVVATLPGTAPTGTVVLAAHTDSVPAGSGAADDVSSVAAILETVRALRAGPPLRDDVGVLLTDGEEAGLLGARAWVRDDLPRDRPTVVLNHEARGVAGPSLVFRTSPGNAGLVRVIADVVPHPRGDSSLDAIFRLLPNDTDLSAVLAAGRPGIDSAFLERPSAYHTAGDTSAALSAASVQSQGSTMLALARGLGDADLRPLDPAVSGLPAQPDEVWFRFLGAFVTYPQGWVVPIAVLTALVLVGAVVLGRRRGVLGVRGAFVATATAAGALVVALGLGAALGALAGSAAGPFSSGLLPYEVVDLALAVLVVLAWALPLRRRYGPYAPAAAAAALLAVLGIASAVVVPGASFLVALPGLGLTLGLAAAVTLHAHPTAAVAALAVGTVPTAALLLPFASQVFLVDGAAHGLAVTAFALCACACVPVLGHGNARTLSGRGAVAVRA